MAEKPVLDPRFDPAFQRGYEPPVQRPQTERIASSPVSVPATSSDDEPAIDIEAGGVNPYVIVLWAIGVVFTIGGVLAYLVPVMGVLRTPDQYQSPDPLTLTLQSLAFLSAAPLVTVGLATMAGLLFLSAVRRRSRSSS